MEIALVGGCQRWHATRLDEYAVDEPRSAGALAAVLDAHTRSTPLQMRPLPLEHQACNHRCRLVVQRGRDVAVDAERDGDGRVAESLLDDAWVDAALQRQSCPRV